jgi:hypothetical protein
MNNDNQNESGKLALIPTTTYNKGPVRVVKSLNPRAAKLMQDYYGIDINNLLQQSPEELGKFADWAKDMERLQKILPILEKHFKTLIAGTVSVNQFYANVQKEAIKGAKTIDKATLASYLSMRGYDLHSGRMLQKAGNEMALQDLGHQHQVQQELTSFETELKLLESKHTYKLAEINDRYLIDNQSLAHAERVRKEDLAEAEQQRYEMDLIEHGHKIATKNRSRTSATQGFGRHVRNFFSNLWTGLGI